MPEQQTPANTVKIPTLDIIIPRHNEPEGIIINVLNSIAGQVGFNFKLIKVTIVDDKSDKKLDANFLKMFPYEIQYIYDKENVGPGVSRQIGIDNTNNDLIMFIDADDRLFSCVTFIEIYRFIMQNINRPWNVISTQWLEENTMGNNYNLIPHQANMVWTHGKIYKRAFLNAYGIRFHDKLRLFEDMYFNKQVVLLSKPEEHLYNPAITYFWASNPNSLTRKNSDKKAYLWTYCDDFIYSADEVMKTLTAKKCERRHEIIINSIALYYYSIQTASFLDGTPESKQKVDRINAEAYRLICTYRDSFERTSMPSKSQFVNAAREECRTHFNFMTELYTWADWLHQLDSQFGPAGSTTAFDIANIKYDTTDNALGISELKPITSVGQ
jgi:glycosyltransferase involved in cell wall biosynthesis